MSKTTIELKVPSVGESVTEVEVADWLKQQGDAVGKDENVVVLETDKATLEIPAPAAGRLTRALKNKGDRVQVGDVLGIIEPGESASAPPAVETNAETTPAATPTPPAPEPEPEPEQQRVMPAAARVLAEKGIGKEKVQGTGPGGRVLKEDAQRASEVRRAEPAQGRPGETSPPPQPHPAPAFASSPEAAEEVVPMSLLRRKIAERLVQAQHNAALLTTFNEIDMSVLVALRREHQERFQERYQVKLGFMSFFVKATIEALKETPLLNAEIRGTNIVYRRYCDIGIAIGGGRGLVVPVLRGAERMSFAEIERAIGTFAQRVKENKITPDELAGGTFTITNGGVYGSLLSTPLVNPPQSGVLGMHAIQDRPVAVQGQVAVRPMMYVALTYDHRLVDGREAVTFLRRVKELVENPVRLLIEV